MDRSCSVRPSFSSLFRARTPPFLTSGLPTRARVYRCAFGLSAPVAGRASAALRISTVAPFSEARTCAGT
eukprot:12645405-Alexandrium_andersonii.AAC.1